MRNLRIIRTARRITDAVRSVVNPAGLIRQQHDQAQQTPATADDPSDLFTEDELPPIEAIEAAALGYDLAADAARSADRAKRKHRKLIDRLPSGTYGQWLIRRVPSSRQTVDLEAVRATYARLGLGEVPMRDTAPSLRVERIAVPADAGTVTELVAA